MKTLSTAVLSATSVLVLVAACSSSDGAPAGPTTSSGGPSGSSVNSAAFVAALCDYLEKCELQAGGAIDKTRCMRESQATFDGANGAPGVTLTQAQVDTCAGKLPGLGCDPSFDPLEELVPECAVTGSLAAGTACARDAQCASGLCLLNEPDGFCGKCTERADVGAACGDLAPCKTGLECDVSSSKCVARPAKGAACTATGARCKGASACIKAVCSDPLPEGTACDPAEGGCAIGLECRDAKCAKRVGSDTLVGPGEECGPDPDARYFRSCKNGSSCVGRSPSKCVVDAKVGEPCGFLVASCEPLAHCDQASQKCIKDDPRSCK